MNISLEAVTKRFEAVTAVDGVSLEIADGELFFLVGPSGCGKTTLLRLLAGFGVPDSGRILFDGACVNELPPHRRNTGMVFQNYALWPHMTVAANVAFGLTVPGRNRSEAERRERVGRVLKAVHMEAFAGRKPSQLSGGQQQRVALARALVIEPGCLLLDEPLSNLDAKLRLDMRLEIRRLVKRTGITAVYVTHDQEEALSMADRCAILREGRVEQVGAPRELYRRPANRFVADFIGGSNLIRGKIRSPTGEEIRVETPGGDWIARARAGAGAGQAGQAVTLGVRQEAVRLAPPAGRSDNVFPATLSEALFCGDRMEYRLLLRDGTEIRATGSGAEPAPAPGEKLAIWIDPADVILLPDG